MSGWCGLIVGVVLGLMVALAAFWVAVLRWARRRP